MSVAETVRLPPARTVEPAPTDAYVPVPVPEFITRTRIDPLTAAEEDAASWMARPKNFSLDVADTVASPPVATVAPVPMDAPTVVLTTSTMRPIPTEEPLVVAAMPPATSTSRTVPLAETTRVCSRPPVTVWLTSTPSPREAVVERLAMSTVTEPVTAALPVPAAPDMTREVNWGRSAGLIREMPGSGFSGSRDDSAFTASALATSRLVRVAVADFTAA